ncbi:MAG: L-threonylcarbamoyladenylate synthase [Pyrinomonadaceae bacterium]
MIKTFFVKTQLTTDPEIAAEFIRRGGIVAFPTETVYGLGADVFDETAVAKIFEAKKRPQDNPLIAHIGSLDQLDQLAERIPDLARLLIETFFPGPLTLVLRKAEAVPLIATAGLDSIGIRMPRHEFAREFLAGCGTPVVAPSANLSGRPSPTTWQAVFEDLDGRIDCILQGEATDIGLESTVVDCTGGRPVVLRQGSVTLDDIRCVVPEAVANDSEGNSRRSPGLRHKHYAPNATVAIIERESKIDDPSTGAYIGLSDREEPFASEQIVGDAAEYAHVLFEFFRECEREGIRKIYCEAVEETGIGSALMDRLRRAAQG